MEKLVNIYLTDDMKMSRGEWTAEWVSEHYSVREVVSVQLFGFQCIKLWNSFPWRNCNQKNGFESDFPQQAVLSECKKFLLGQWLNPTEERHVEICSLVLFLNAHFLLVNAEITEI